MQPWGFPVRLRTASWRLRQNLWKLGTNGITSCPRAAAVRRKVTQRSRDRVTLVDGSTVRHRRAHPRPFAAAAGQQTGRHLTDPEIGKDCRAFYRKLARNALACYARKEQSHEVATHRGK